MIRAIIVDDERHCIEQLSYLLARHCAESVNLMGAFESVEEGAQAIRQLKPELIFLDVQIKGKTGFDLLEEFSEINFEVIFITAYEKYALLAFKFSAVDYLLKPVQGEYLEKAVEKLQHKFLLRDTAKANVEALLFNMQSKSFKSRRLAIPNIKGFEMIEIDDIIYCEADNRYTDIFFKSKPKITSTRLLKEYEEQLSYYDFFRVHQSYLVSFKYVASYNSKAGIVKMTNDKEIDVSLRKRKEFNDWIEAH
ncbi:LytTR family DNA-binding domain-containing protein [Runella sp.]|jgi:two-component system LytT family response regulator|uniref:LytR/AlgR family response regulator transcription factor n=1 Tax=Runella sp. TaxID=1960881 RepID=UPI00260BB328|nr:LytTR family DNA-binding domain-containing protein [Runella sp.]